MDLREFLSNIEGRDEDGVAKAMVSANIIYVDPVNYEEADIEEGSDFYTYDGAVYVAISPGNLSLVDVIFDDPMDYDYLNLAGLCEKYNECLKKYNQGIGNLPMLNITLSEQGEINNSLNMINCVWSYVPVSADKICSGIRFIVLTDNITYSELSDEQVDVILDELGSELLTAEYQEV